MEFQNFEFCLIFSISGAEHLAFRLIRTIKLSIYKAIASPSDGRQITFTCSIYLIIEAMAPGNDIFDKTGEIPAFLKCLEAPAKNTVPWLRGFSTSTFCLHELREAARVVRPGVLRG